MGESSGQLTESLQESLKEYKSGYMAARNLAGRSRVEYETDVTKFLSFVKGLGVGEIEDIEPRHIHAYMAEFDRQGLAGATRRKKLVIIKNFFAWLKAVRFIDTDPAKRIIPPQRDDKEPRVLTQKEYRRLLKAAKKPRQRAIIQLLLQTGIKLSEIQRLRLSDIVVPKKITKDTLGTMLIRGKQEMRVIPLNFRACKALASWLAVRPSVKSDAVFVSNYCKPLSARQYQRMVKKCLKLAGIKGASVHTLRHTFGAHHLARGADAKTVKKLMGVKTGDTIKLYLDLVKRQQVQAVRRHPL